MRGAGIAGVSRRRSVRTTLRDRKGRPAPDLVDRNFTAEGPNRLWVAEPKVRGTRHHLHPDPSRRHSALGYLSPIDCEKQTMPEVEKLTP